MRYRPLSIRSRRQTTGGKGMCDDDDDDGRTTHNAAPHPVESSDIQSLHPFTDALCWPKHSFSSLIIPLVSAVAIFFFLYLCYPLHVVARVHCTYFLKCKFLSSFFPVVSELVQQHTSTIVSYGEVFVPSRKIHRGDVTQRSLCRRPISKGGERREVDLSYPSQRERPVEKGVQKRGEQRTKRI